MGYPRLPIVLLAALPLGLVSNGTAAQVAGPDTAVNRCFEIVFLQGQTPVAGPLLFDRCTGATWLLVRRAAGRHSRKHVYRWEPVGVEDAMAANRHAGAAAANGQKVQPSMAGEKCFVLSARRYCE